MFGIIWKKLFSIYIQSFIVVLKTIQYLYSIIYCDPYEISIDYLNEIIKRLINVGNKLCREKIKDKIISFNP